MNKIITIGRQFGSGGREFGRRLAQELGVEYYDKEIVTEIAKHTSLSEEYVQSVIEKRPHPLFPITTGQSFFMSDAYYLKQVGEIYSKQSEIIKELATRSDCVIVGRCSDYILRDFKPFRIFVYAEMQSRIARCIARDENGVTDEKQIKKQIERVDKDRAAYYEFYTGKRWGAKENYDLCLNTTGIEIKEVVPHLAKIF